MHVRVCAVVVATALGSSVVSPASAQSLAHSSTPGEAPWRVFGGVGLGQVTDDEGSLGHGPELTFGVGRRLSRTWSLEAVVMRHHHERGDAFRVDADVTGALGRVVAHVGGEASAARFFVSFGAGVARHAGSVGFAGGPPEAPVEGPRSKYAATGGVAEFGLGLDVRVGRRWFIRPELRARSAHLDRTPHAPEPPYLTGVAGVTIGWRP